MIPRTTTFSPSTGNMMVGILQNRACFREPYEASLSYADTKIKITVATLFLLIALTLVTQFVFHEIKAVYIAAATIPINLLVVEKIWREKKNIERDFKKAYVNTVPFSEFFDAICYNQVNDEQSQILIDHLFEDQLALFLGWVRNEKKLKSLPVKFLLHIKRYVKWLTQLDNVRFTFENLKDHIFLRCQTEGFYRQCFLEGVEREVKDDNDPVFDLLHKIDALEDI